MRTEIKPTFGQELRVIQAQAVADAVKNREDLLWSAIDGHLRAQATAGRVECEWPPVFASNNMVKYRGGWGAALERDTAMRLTPEHVGRLRAAGIRVRRGRRWLVFPADFHILSWRHA